MPSPDIHHKGIFRDAFWKRVGSATPPLDRSRIRRLRVFVRKWIKSHLDPLAATTDVSHSTWAEESSLPRWKVDAYIEALRENHWHVEPSDAIADGFLKDEDYLEVKAGRLIHSRRARFKAAVGPIFHQIEKSVFSQLSRYFVKYLPVCDRPRRMKQMEKAGSIYVGTDYSKFEATITRELMSAVELQLYSYMVGNLSDVAKSQFLGLLHCLSGVNHMRYKEAKAKVPATRMSGDMCTSLGNGFTNLMVFLFVCKEKGLDIEHLDGVVEGDDGLFVMSQDILSPHDFESLGLLIKIVKNTDIGRTGFCSLYFDTQDLENVADPAELLAKFGWTRSCRMHCRPDKLKELLRAKAFSLAYELPGCPVAGALARMALRLTRGHRVVFDTPDGSPSYWASQCLQGQTELTPEIDRRLQAPISMRTRHLVEDLFGVSVPLQIQIEETLDNMTSIEPLDFKDLRVPDSWKDDWDNYVACRGPGEVSFVCY